jgi:hypothetical protein
MSGLKTGARVNTPPLEAIIRIFFCTQSACSGELHYFKLSNMRLLKKFSTITLILIFSLLFIFRVTHVEKNEISWDVLGYYLYLPATIIHHDPLLKDITWLQELNSEKNLTGTLYQLTYNKNGEPMYFFPYGYGIVLPSILFTSTFLLLLFWFSHGWF